MKVKTLLRFLQDFTQEDEKNMEKEVSFYDMKENIAYYLPKEVEVVDLSDDNYLDIVFNN